MRHVLFLHTLLLVIPLAVRASVLHVPADFARIETALNAAGAGDTVLVSPGTYVENIIWPATAALKLLSAAGPSQTILDGDGVDQVVGIYTPVDTTTQLRGFTIRNGYASGT